MSDSGYLSEIRSSVRAICRVYGEDYWRELDSTKSYPTQFVKDLTDAGFLGCLIPECYGGSGLGLVEACAILEEISRSGGHPGAAHAQMYVMGSILRHGTDAQKKQYLPKVASGELRLQSFAVTEPTTGSDTTALKTTAKLTGDHYRVNGQKVWISRVQHSDLMLLLARTKPIEQCRKKTEGLSCFIVDLQGAEQRGLTIRPIDAAINHHSCELFFDEFEVPVQNRLGPEHQGFNVILDSMNAERTLIAAECVGDARYFIDKATSYANQREVFGTPIGKNQGVAFPIAEVYAHTEAAALLVERAASLFDSHQACGAEANMAKMLAAKASSQAADICLQTYGGFGFSREFHIERKQRETRLYQIAPVSTNLILAYISEHILKMPRSF